MRASTKRPADAAAGGSGLTGRPVRVPKAAELIADAVRAQIARGELRPGSPLPNETELMSHFGLGWDNLALSSGGTIGFQDSGLPWARNPDNGLRNVCSTDPATGTTMRIAADCTGQTQTMANMRFRMNPEIHVTDNIVLHAQLDVFDNLVLGSTPEGFYINGRGGAADGYPTIGTRGQVPQESVINALQSSIRAKRAGLSR